MKRTKDKKWHERIFKKLDFQCEWPSNIRVHPRNLRLNIRAFVLKTPSRKFLQNVLRGDAGGFVLVPVHA